MAPICLPPTWLAASDWPDPLEATRRTGERLERSESPRRRDAGQRPQRQRELDDVRRRLTDLYDECLYGLDAELGRFLRELRAEGRLANTWVVITADHGEHFGEHHCFGHGSSLYNEQTHVPLVLIPPLGAEGTGTDERPGSVVDGSRFPSHFVTCPGR